MVQRGPRDPHECGLDGLQVSAGVPRGDRSGDVDPAGRGHTASALAVLGVALPALAVAVSVCRARGRGCGKSEVEAFELCVLLSQASAAAVSLWPRHRRVRPPMPWILPPRMEAWPDDFLCSISLEVMTDPVILPSDHTFERRSIQRWLNGEHLTCLVTSHPLPPSPLLIPNHAFHHLVAAAVAPVGGDGSREAKETGSPSSVLALLRLTKSGAAGRREVLESGNVAVLLRQWWMRPFAKG
jgi:hypothetical protein